MKKVMIIGAGFSGLATAFYLVRLGVEVEIFEARTRVGGMIQTLHTSHGPVETAANAFLNSALVEELFRECGVPLIGTRREARRRYIFRAGVCRRWPVGFFASLRFAWFAVRFALARSTVAPREGEVIQAWGRRVLGDEATQYLLDAGLQGIYAGDPSRMSARLILGRYFAPRRSSTPARPRGSVSAPEGMGQLIAALETYLRSRGVRIQFGARGRLAGEHAAVIATGPHEAAEMLAEILPEKARLLKQIELSPVITTTAFFQQTDSRSRGFGVLFAPVERRRALGVLKNTFIFDGRGEFAETWIQGGALANPAVTEQTDAAILDSIVTERMSVFRLNDRPREAVVTRWPKGIPHYTVELERMIPSLEKPEKNIRLMGNYLGDLGLAKILERAQRLAQELQK